MTVTIEGKTANRRWCRDLAGNVGYSTATVSRFDYTRCISLTGQERQDGTTALLSKLAVPTHCPALLIVSQQRSSPLKAQARRFPAIARIMPGCHRPRR